jgi:hypothetical protein
MRARRELEGLGHIIVGTGIEAKDGVAIGVVTCQHQDRAFHPAFAHPATQLAAIGIGQADIKDHKVIDRGLDLFHALGGVARLEHIEVFGHDQLFAQRFAQIVVIIDKQDFSQGHHNATSVRFDLRCGVGGSFSSHAAKVSRSRVTAPRYVSISQCAG